MTNLKWPEVKLGDYAEVTPGYAFDSDEFTDNSKDISLVKGSNVQQGYIDWDESKYWPREQASEFDDFLLEEGDVVLAMDRPWVESGLKWAWIRHGDPEALLVQRIARLRSKNELSQEYLRYVIGSPSFESYIRPIVTGVTVPHISGTQIEEYTFSLPPLEYQQKATSILSSIDKLIQNNIQRIRILERIPDLVYREWFAQFQYPGSEQVKTKDSEMGEIPEEWDVDQVGNQFEVVLGGTPARKNSENWGGNIPWIKSGKVNEMRVMQPSEYITEEGLNGCTTELMPKGTSLIAITGATLGQVSMLGIESAANQSVVGVYDESEVANEYIYYTLKDRIKELAAYASGGAQQHINKTIVSEFKIIVPPKSIVELFHDVCAPMNDLILNLERQNIKLRGTRQLLLPRIMNGELDISELSVLIQKR